MAWQGEFAAAEARLQRLEKAREAWVAVTTRLGSASLVAALHAHNEARRDAAKHAYADLGYLIEEVRRLRGALAIQREALQLAETFVEERLESEYNRKTLLAWVKGALGDLAEHLGSSPERGRTEDKALSALEAADALVEAADDIFHLGICGAGMEALEDACKRYHAARGPASQAPDGAGAGGL